MTNKEFARRRRALRISQGRIAQRAGVSQSLVSEFEVGYRSLSDEKVLLLTAALRDEMTRAARAAQRELAK